MKKDRLEFSRNQAIYRATSEPCSDSRELLETEAAKKVLVSYLAHLQKHGSHLLSIFPSDLLDSSPRKIAGHLKPVLISLLNERLRDIESESEITASLYENRQTFHQFIEKLYDHWREYNRFLVHSPEERNPGHSHERPYLKFNREIEHFTELVRSAYRDVAENITESHPIIYRQVAAGFEVGLVVSDTCPRYPEVVDQKLCEIPTVQQVTIMPPLVLDPPMNKRAGRFRRVETNPLLNSEVNPRNWLRFPAKVGELRIDVLFHKEFIDLGSSLANLFELATGSDLDSLPDALFAFGLSQKAMSKYEEPPIVFYDDESSGILYGAVPRRDKFGYFGYLKKMMLTLHNIQMMKRGRMPIHGAMMSIALKGGIKANLAILGDSGAGKSETLEAFRMLGEEKIQDIEIICDDMGSLKIGDSGEVMGYGTETGAFVRLDDLKQGYAFSQLDRSIFMSPQRTNARALMPVAPIESVVGGIPIHYLFYANNYEEIDEDHPVIDRFDDPAEALSVFREGARMAKGTTDEKGLVHAYFANLFGPAQYRDLHESIANKMFRQLFQQDVYVGEIRTRLGIEGYERKGPEAVAKALLDLFQREKGND